MSTASRVRKSSPVKQGPMRATIPMSSLLKQSTGFRKSPTLSPTTSASTSISTYNWRCRSSPDNTTISNSGQRSPGSVTYKAKCKLDALTCKGAGNIIRRTASLDTIYLKGQWPRDTFYFQCGLLQVDKATQTEPIEASSMMKCFRNVTTDEESPSSTSSCLNEEKCFHRQRQRSSKERDRIYNMCCGILSTSIDGGTTITTTTTTTTAAATTKACPVNIPIIKPMIKPPMRNSIEGLNQEIERLVLKGNLSNNSPKGTGTFQLRSTSNNSMEREDFELDLHLNLDEMTPEGHRAPLADLLRSTRSVNTQTPSAGPFQRKSDSASASESNSNSNSPDDYDDDQLCCSSSRFFSTSPHINKFLAREPPDGCERVNLRFYEDTGVSTLLNPPNVTFQLKPSLGSAFQPLKSHHNTDDSVSSNSNNNAQTPG